MRTINERKRSESKDIPSGISGSSLSLLRNFCAVVSSVNSLDPLRSSFVSAVMAFDIIRRKDSQTHVFPPREGGRDLSLIVNERVRMTVVFNGPASNELRRVI